MLEKQTFQMEVKATTEGVIEGYASIFGVVDQGRDVVQKGAFLNSLRSGRKIKMLRDHDPRKVVGVWDDLAEDGNGLRGKGRLAMQTQLGRETAELVTMGALDGLSIGYKTMDDSVENGVRYLKEVSLWEVSVVTFPMSEASVIDAVKAADMTKKELERVLTHDAKLTRSVARALMRGGFEAMQVKHDADDAGAEKLKAVLAALSQS